MAVTISDKGFYAVVNFASPGKEITALNYGPGKTVYTPPYLIVIEPADFTLYGQPVWDGVSPPIRTELEAFLQTLYGAGASLTSNSVQHNLDTAINEAGLAGDYAKVQVVDFMAFTGALKRYQTLQDGTQVDLLSLGLGDTRPNLNDLERNEDFNLMYGIIDHLGVQGILPYLYVKEGINFKQFCDRIRVWKQEKEEREVWVYQTLIPLLRVQKAPVLTEAQVQELIKA